jgi:hypothetical protein
MAEGGAETTPEKGGRNVDGTFAKGHTPYIAENCGRPKDRFSHRAMAAKRAQENPNSIKKDLDVLDEIIANPDNSPLERAKAIELKIKLFGGFDVQETKTELTGKVENAIPFSNLSQKEVEALLKKYDKR